MEKQYSYKINSWKPGTKTLNKQIKCLLNRLLKNGVLNINSVVNTKTGLNGDDFMKNKATLIVTVKDSE